MSEVPRSSSHPRIVGDADRARAWRQLAFEGMNPAKIARAIRAKNAIAEPRIAVASNDLGAVALVEHDLNWTKRGC